MISSKVGIPIERLDVSAYVIPTDGPESDGTHEWHNTTLVLVEAYAGGKKGTGFTYSCIAASTLIHEILIEAVKGRDAMAVPASWLSMVRAIRNMGRPGIASSAIAAVDNALWDLKARILDLPLVTLLGQVHDSIPIYGSGGFTSYSIGRLEDQLAGWVSQGFRMVKMKVGRVPADDIMRVKAARKAIGSSAELFVDANGAYSRSQALSYANAFSELGVTWFEEPVPSDDLEGLNFIRNRAPAGMDIAAGEYGYDLNYFRVMLEAGAVDVLQADATRCAGITEFMRVGALCHANNLQLSAHTAPSIHMHPCCALGRAAHVEYFYDHARIEHMLFEGVVDPTGGSLRPDLSRPGMGLEFKHADAERFAA